MTVISAARDIPIERGRNHPSPGIMPTLTKFSAKTALSLARRMSDMIARSQPAP
nr:hypothetical protein [Mesorhizobium sp.]